MLCSCVCEREVESKSMIYTTSPLFFLFVRVCLD